MRTPRSRGTRIRCSKPGGGSSSATPFLRCAPERGKILGIAAERWCSRFLWALDHRAPAMIVIEGFERQRIADAGDIETEI